MTSLAIFATSTLADYVHEAPYHYYHHDSYHMDHHTHPELDHRYDDAHDVTPVPYHDHRVLPAVDRPESHSYGHGAYYDNESNKSSSHYQERHYYPEHMAREHAYKDYYSVYPDAWHTNDKPATSDQPTY